MASNPPPQPLNHLPPPNEKGKGEALDLDTLSKQFPGLSLNPSQSQNPQQTTDEYEDFELDRELKVLIDKYDEMEFKKEASRKERMIMGCVYAIDLHQWKKRNESLARLKRFATEMALNAPPEDRETKELCAMVIDFDSDQED